MVHRGASCVLMVMGRALVAGAMSWGVAAPAQQVVISKSIDLSGRPGGAGDGAQVSARSLERYGKVLAFSAAQSEAATALLEGYLSESRAAAKEARSAMESAFTAYQDTQDDKALRKATVAARQEQAARAKALESGFLADMRQMLTPEQEGRWERLERLRRREKGLAWGALSGEAVDLTEVIDGLGLDAAATASLAEEVEQYEADIDRAIQARDAALPAAAPGDEGPKLVFDMSAMQGAMAKARQAGARVRDVNQSHERKMEVLLPEGRRADFALAFKRRCFPEVYRPAAVARAMGAAAKLADLTGEQKAAVEEVRLGYEREAAAANDAWAQAIVASEADGSDGAMSMGGGSVIRIQFGGEESGPLADARKARKAIDDKARERLDAILTPAQRERLPTGEEGAEVAAGTGSGG